MGKRSHKEGINLSPRERQIMDAVYQLGEATANDICSALPVPLANATVRTILRILEEKGHLRHREEGRTYVYRPAHSKQSAAHGALRRILGVFYNGSVTQAFSGLLDLSDTRLSDAELDDLQRIIDEARDRKTNRQKP